MKIISNTLFWMNGRRYRKRAVSFYHFVYPKGNCDNSTSIRNAHFSNPSSNRLNCHWIKIDCSMHCCRYRGEIKCILMIELPTRISMLVWSCGSSLLEEGRSKMAESLIVGTFSPTGAVLSNPCQVESHVWLVRKSARISARVIFGIYH